MAVWGCYYLTAIQQHQNHHHHHQTPPTGVSGLPSFPHNHSMMVPEPWRMPPKKRKLEYPHPSSSLGSTNNGVSSSSIPSYKCAKMPKLHQHQQQPSYTSTSQSSATMPLVSGTVSTLNSSIATSKSSSSTLTSSSSNSKLSSTSSSSAATGVAVASGGDTSRLLYDRRGRGSVTFRPYTDSLLECSVLKGNCLDEYRSGHYQSGGARNKRGKQPFLFGYGCDGNFVGSYQNSNYYLPLAKNPRACMMLRNGDSRERVEVEKSYTVHVKTTVGNLFPEILSIIFEYLDVASKGRAAQVR